jgi:hypothetical protein
MRRVEILRTARKLLLTFEIPRNTQNTPAMTSQTRGSKRTHSSIEPESPLSPRTSQRKKRASYKVQQSTLPFAPSQLSQVSTPRRRRPTTPPILCQEASRESTLSPTPGTSSLASSSVSTARSTTIRALKRVFFEVDFDLVGHEYSVRARTSRAIKHSRISWIYLHGMELEKEKGNHKYWFCKHCYDVGKSKILNAGSTAGISKHLNTTHDIYSPGTTPSVGNTVDSYLEGVHPLQAERWREDFVNWITYDNISFEQAASP